MNNVDLFLERPLWMLLLIPAFLVILLPFFRQPAKKRKTVKRLLPLVLHILISVLLILLISGFSFAAKADQQAVILLLDNSDSMASVQDEVQQYAEQLASLIDQEIPIGVVVFGKDAISAVDLDSMSRTISLKDVEGDASNLETALNYAASLFPSDRSGRIILISDGKQTEGDAASAAHNLGNQDIRIDTVYLDTTELDTAEIQLSSFTADEAAYIGNTITFTAEYESNTQGTAVLNLYDNEQLAESQSIEITEGSGISLLTYEAKQEGNHTFRLALDTADDTIINNNVLETCVTVYKSPSVLIIYGDNADETALEKILSEHLQTDAVSAALAPENIIGLCDYDEVILLNVNKIELPNQYDQLLEQYVSDYGRSLLIVGGRNTLIYGGMQESAFEDFLPVTFEYQKADDGEPVALMLVLDCSMSMSNNSTNLAVAKQGAIKSVNAMTENDFVGIVSFNSTAYLKSPLIKATEANKESLVRIISELNTSQGTYYTEAFEQAYEALKDSDQNIRHILFLSDGNPSDSAYTEPIKSIVADGITISTIGLGYSSEILSKIADYAGGRYYYIASEADLPSIMLSETEQVTASSLVEQTVTPVIAISSELTNNLEMDALPQLDGYLGLSTKEDANAYITTEDGDPIFAVWNYGKGTVACFTSDLTEKWSADWLTSSLGNELIERMVTTTVNPIHSDTTLVSDITTGSRKADITVTTSAADTTHLLTVTVSDGSNEQLLELEQTNLGIYRGAFDVESQTIYSVHIEEKDTKEQLLDESDVFLAVPYPAEYDAFADGGLELLNDISSYADGICTDDMEQLSEVELSVIRLNYIPLFPFALTILIFLLADIAIRKLRWKDIRNYFLIVKNKFRKNKISR